MDEMLATELVYDWAYTWVTQLDLQMEKMWEKLTD
jgi:hypothetical protein